MLKNYFKIAWRNLKKRKGFALINLVGLATGLAVCLLITLYIDNELGYDKFQTKGDRIYRLALERKYPGRSTFFAEIPVSIGQAVKQEFPGVLETVRIISASGPNTIVSVGDKVFEDDKIFGADSNFFKVFSGDFVLGDKNDALAKPNTAVITESIANRIYGSPALAIGKNFKKDEFQEFTVSGVCRNWPEKSHFQFDILLSNSTFHFDEPNYYDLSFYTYLLLEENSSAKSLEAKFPSVITKYVAPTIEKGFGETFESFIKEGNGYNYFLQPIRDIHLHSELIDEFRPNGSIKIIYMLVGIGLFILFLACINFINLSTAISVERAREVGIRKTFGSDKKSILWQFLFESVLFSFAALIISGILVWIFLPILSNISGNSLSLKFFFAPVQLFVLLCFSFLIGIIAGIYPAWVIASFKPIIVLKDRFKSGTRGLALRNGLVIFQFSISVILIICTMVVSRQMNYIMGNSLGFRKDHIISIDGIGRLLNNRRSFIDEVSRIPGVLDWSNSILPDGRKYASCSMQAIDTRQARTQLTTYVDDRYLGLLGLQLKEGRFLSKDFGTDSTAMILNERAVEDFGLKNPIGARITCNELNFNPPDGKTKTIYTVVGVVKDFHFQPLHERISPLVMANTSKFNCNELAILVNGKDIENTLAFIEKTWKQLSTNRVFDYHFLDQKLADQYKAERSEQKIFVVFSVLAILIACIGLFGLSVYSTLQRIKEIGIRKVLGASTENIIYVLSKDFLKLVLISALIAFPVAWLAMHKWLQSFAYRIELSWWVFALAGVSAVFIALITISTQAIKAAIANPVESLRVE